MSTIKLNSITVESDASNPNFYVASIIRSNSGFQIPKLINGIDDLNVYFGEFKYKELFKHYIEEDIPVLLMPVITPLSPYNYCSLRLNSNNLPSCHPKLGKSYIGSLDNNLIIKEFTSDELTEEYALNYYTTLSYNLKYSLVINNSETLTYSRYFRYLDEDDQEKVGIEFRFTGPTSGTITIEEFPLFDNDEFITEDTFTAGEYVFQYDSRYVPEVVLVTQEGVTQLHQSEITNSSEFSEITIQVDDIINYYFITIRLLPLYLQARRITTSIETIIKHNLGHYPIIKLLKDSIGALGAIIYSDENILIVSTDSGTGVEINYNVLINKFDYDWTKVASGESSYNIVLDFSKVIQSDLITESYYYVVINTISGKILIQTLGNPSISDRLSYTLYDQKYTLSGESKTEILSNLLDYLKIKVGDVNCKSELEIINEFLEEFISIYETPSESNFIEWKNQLILYSYSYDFWLFSNYEVEDVFNESFIDINLELDILSQLKSNLESLLPIQKILINHIVPTQNQRLFSLPNFYTYQLDNLTQDKLCEITESNKICEFFSKIKGDSSKNIEIKINKLQRYSDRYSITVQLGSKLEVYYICTNLDEVNLPDDFIKLNNINLYSELITIKVYDYRLSTGKIIDSNDFELYRTETEIYNPINLIELTLPEGSWNLGRIVNEVFRIEDELNSLKLFSESNWYPDLFLVPEMDYGVSNQNYLKYVLNLVKGSEVLKNPITGFENSLYSQALIKINPNFLAPEFELISEYNRLIYFYGDIILDGDTLPSFYPTSINLLKGTYISIIKDKIIYDVFSYKIGNYVNYQSLPAEILNVESDRLKIRTFSGVQLYVDKSSSDLNTIENLLIDKCVNYIKYTNLYYYYDDFIELPDQNSYFIIQFITSKFSRGLSEINSIKALPESDIQNLLSRTFNQIKSLLPLVSKLTYSTKRLDNQLDISLNVSIKQLTNKTYKLNYIINI